MSENNLKLPVPLADISIWVTNNTLFNPSWSFELRIIGTGEVSVKSTDQHPPKHEMTSIISPGEVREFIALAMEVGFFEMGGDYHCKSELKITPDGYLDQDLLYADDYGTTEMEITIGDYQHMVISSCGAPKRLQELRERIYDITGVLDWLKG